MSGDDRTERCLKCGETDGELVDIESLDDFDHDEVCSKNPLRKLEVRTLRPALVENQRIDSDRFEADRSLEPRTERSKEKA